MPVSLSSRDTCPPTCTWFDRGCYAEVGFLCFWWRRVAQSGVDWHQFCHAIAALPEGTLWRHNAAGDRWGLGDELDVPALYRLGVANHGRHGFTYTHKPLRTATERAAVRTVNANGFTINLSADTLEQADRLSALQLAPVVLTLPLGVRWRQTPAGRPIVRCPAVPNEFTCQDCRRCAQPHRTSIIGLVAHGARRWQMTERLCQGELFGPSWGESA